MNRKLLFLTVVVVLGACTVLARESQRGKAILQRLKLLSDQVLLIQRKILIEKVIVISPSRFFNMAATRPICMGAPILENEKTLGTEARKELGLFYHTACFRIFQINSTKK